MGVNILGTVVMVDRDDVMGAYECVNVGILDLVLLQARDLEHSEDLVIVQIELRQLRRTHGVIDSQAMQPEPLLQDSEVAVKWVKDFDPDKR